MQNLTTYLSVLATALTATAGHALAQTVTLTSTLPVAAQVSINGQSQSATLPAGVLPSAGDLSVTQNAVIGGAAATNRLAMDWNLVVEQFFVHLRLGHSATAALPVGSVPSTATRTPAEFVLRVSNPTAMMAELSLSLVGYAVPGTRILEVDVGNDGSVEFQQALGIPQLQLPIAVGPTPLEIKIRSEFSSATPVSGSDAITLEIAPTASLGLTTVTSGCSTGSELRLWGTFTNGLYAYVTNPLQAPRPSVLVFGLSAQPLFLPSYLTGSVTAPCFFWPAVDATFLLLPGLPTPSVEIAIPPAFRPGTFWTQAVVLETGGMRTTSGYRVSAF